MRVIPLIPIVDGFNPYHSEYSSHHKKHHQHKPSSLVETKNGHGNDEDLHPFRDLSHKFGDILVKSSEEVLQKEHQQRALAASIANDKKHHHKKHHVHHASLRKQATPHQPKPSFIPDVMKEPYQPTPFDREDSSDSPQALINKAYHLPPEDDPRNQRALHNIGSEPHPETIIGGSNQNIYVNRANRMASIDRVQPDQVKIPVKPSTIMFDYNSLMPPMTAEDKARFQYEKEHFHDEPHPFERTKLNMENRQLGNERPHDFAFEVHKRKTEEDEARELRQKEEQERAKREQYEREEREKEEFIRQKAREIHERTGMPHKSDVIARPQATTTTTQKVASPKPTTTTTTQRAASPKPTTTSTITQHIASPKPTTSTTTSTAPKARHLPAGKVSSAIFDEESGEQLMTPHFPPFKPTVGELPSDEQIMHTDTKPRKQPVHFPEPNSNDQVFSMEEDQPTRNRMVPLADEQIVSGISPLNKHGNGRQHTDTIHVPVPEHQKQPHTIAVHEDIVILPNRLHPDNKRPKNKKHQVEEDNALKNEIQDDGWHVGPYVQAKKDAVCHIDANQCESDISLESAARAHRRHQKVDTERDWLDGSEHQIVTNIGTVHRADVSNLVHETVTEKVMKTFVDVLAKTIEERGMDGSELAHHLQKPTECSLTLGCKHGLPKGGHHHDDTTTHSPKASPKPAHAHQTSTKPPHGGKPGTHIPGTGDTGRDTEQGDESNAEQGLPPPYDKQHFKEWDFEWNNGEIKVGSLAGQRIYMHDVKIAGFSTLEKLDLLKLPNQPHAPEPGMSLPPMGSLARIGELDFYAKAKIKPTIPSLTTEMLLYGMESYLESTIEFDLTDAASLQIGQLKDFNCLSRHLKEIQIHNLTTRVQHARLVRPMDIPISGSVVNNVMRTIENENLDEEINRAIAKQIALSRTLPCEPIPKPESPEPYYDYTGPYLRKIFLFIDDTLNVQKDDEKYYTANDLANLVTGDDDGSVRIFDLARLRGLDRVGTQIDFHLREVMVSGLDSFKKVNLTPLTWDTMWQDLDIELVNFTMWMDMKITPHKGHGPPVQNDFALSAAAVNFGHTSNLGMVVSKPESEYIHMSDFENLDNSCVTIPVKNITISNYTVHLKTFDLRLTCPAMPDPGKDPNDHLDEPNREAICMSNKLKELGKTLRKQDTKEQIEWGLQQGVDAINKKDPNIEGGSKFAEGITAFLNSCLETFHETCLHPQTDKPWNGFNNTARMAFLIAFVVFIGIAFLAYIIFGLFGCGPRDPILPDEKGYIAPYVDSIDMERETGGRAAAAVPLVAAGYSDTFHSQDDNFPISDVESVVSDPTPEYEEGMSFMHHDEHMAQEARRKARHQRNMDKRALLQQRSMQREAVVRRGAQAPEVQATQEGVAYDDWGREPSWRDQSHSGLVAGRIDQLTESQRAERQRQLDAIAAVEADRRNAQAFHGAPAREGTGPSGQRPSNDSQTTYNSQASISRPLYDEGRLPCLSSHHIVRFWMKIFVPCYLLANICLFASSNFGYSNEIYVKFTFADMDLQFVVETPTITSALRDMREAGAWPLYVAILIVGIIWPYTKLALLGFCWFCPSKWMSYNRRGKFLELLDMFGKWAYGDMFLMVFMMVSFTFNISNSNDWKVLKLLPKDFLFIEMLVQPGFSFFTFIIAAFMSQILPTFLMWLHRRASAFDRVPTDRRSAALAPLQLSIPGVKDPTTKYPLSMHKYKLSEGVDDGRYIQLTFVGRHLVTLAILGAFVMLGFSVFVMTAEFSWLGVVRHFMAEESMDRTYSIWTMGMAILNNIGTDENVGFDIGVAFIWFAYMFRAVWMALVLMISTLILWLVPLSLKGHREIHVITELCNSWHALDVYVPFYVITVMAIAQLGKNMVRHHMSFLSSLLTTFHRLIPNQDLIAFSMDANMLPAFAVVITLAVWLALGGNFFMMASRSALEDRTFEVGARKARTTLWSQKYQHGSDPGMHWFYKLLCACGLARVSGEHNQQSDEEPPPMTARQPSSRGGASAYRNESYGTIGTYRSMQQQHSSSGLEEDGEFAPQYEVNQDAEGVVQMDSSRELDQTTGAGGYATAISGGGAFVSAPSSAPPANPEQSLGGAGRGNKRKSPSKRGMSKVPKDRSQSPRRKKKSS